MTIFKYIAEQAKLGNTEEIIEFANAVEIIIKEEIESLEYSHPRVESPDDYILAGNIESLRRLLGMKIKGYNKK